MASKIEPTNASIAEVLGQIGDYLEMQKVPFKPRAYQKVSQTVAALEEEVSELYNRGGIKALMDVPGIGAGIAQHIEEIIKTGRSKYYDELKHDVPVQLDKLSRIEGLGPRSIQKLYQTLGIKNLKDLEKAAKAGKIATLEGFGKKSEEKILKGIRFAEDSGKRFILEHKMPRINSMRAILEKVPGAERVTIAGSARRKKETIGDVDILVIAKDSKKIMDVFVSMPDVLAVSAHGPTKSSIKVRPGINVDLRVVPRESYGAALNYFTGSKAHNVALRSIAVKKNMKLNEYGLYSLVRGKEKMIAGAVEKDIYNKLGLDYIEPELREDTGEIQAAQKHTLPKLIEYGSLMGDLQTQTDWTDGADSIEAMARAAMARGLSYIAITDHTKRLAMAHGLDEVRIRRQMAEIDRVNKKLGGKIKILKGSECDILKDGSLDLPDEILAKLDVVGASVHSHFTLLRADQTARVKRAIENPNVDILFHPTGRLINKRPPIELDIEAIIVTAKKTGTIMEVNSFPERSDLKDEYIRKCMDAGVKIAINSDSHAITHFSLLDNGISQARRGWAEKKDVINAWPLEKMLKFLKK